MHGRLRACLELVRPANVLTALPGGAVGYLLATGEVWNGTVIVRLALISACFYAGGIALNDVRDAARDARERPERPIPSGRIARSSAAVLAGVLLAVGLGQAVAMSARVGMAGGTLLLLILAYNTRWKQSVLGPFLMAGCRAANLGLGLAAGGTGFEPFYFVPLGAVGLYTAGLTVFARNETGRPDSRTLWAGAISMTAAPLLLLLLLHMNPDIHKDMTIGVAAMAAFHAVFGWRTVRQLPPVIEPSSNRGSGPFTSGWGKSDETSRGLKPAARDTETKNDLVRRHVTWSVYGFPALDACLCWGAKGAWAALPVVALIPVTIWMGRRFRVS
ncbi:MAG: hypothetical protein D6788_10535 [Planctomycetota bacterium]|nr:MAG: hypothetical protein D6788_10535 [Planctomycetota bacterium]